jgi:UDP-2,3-diacylglucosamine pyrophosphatase LpxH
MPGKFKIVVSDLHLSADFAAEGNRLEDFHSAQEFAAFLEEVAAESDREGADVELIVNGDGFEMLQVPNLDEFDPAFRYPPEEYHSSSEADSVLKMDLIIAGHRPFFEGLGRFIRLGPPRRSVTLVSGNHDLNLYWPAVQERIRQAIGATSGRASLLSFEAWRVCREGIYVEHGNQYAEFLNRIEDMEEPLDQDDPDQLDLPVGSWFVMDVFNEVEWEKYWVDGVKPITALIWYALVFDFPFAARALATLLRALPGILGEGVLAPSSPEGLAEEDPQAGVVQQLEDPAQVAEMAARYEADETYRAQFNAQVARILAAPAEEVDADAPPLALAPDAVSQGDKIRAQVHSSLYKAARERAREEGATVVTFGHTHDAGVEPLPNDGVYINSGTWTWRADFTGAGKETWQELFEYPERFTDDRLLSYVRIDYDDEGQPAGRLLAYEPSSGPEEESPEELASLWEWLLGWLRELWARIAGAD